MLTTIRYIIVTLFFAVLSTNAYAACSSPAGVEGEQGYNLTGTDEYVYCDGTNWTPMHETTPVSINPIAHWKLDETTGSTIADSAGTNTGTWTDDNNSVAEETTIGAIDNALTFLDASNNAIITVPNDASLEGFSEFTLSAWVKPSANSTSSGGRIISKSNGATSDDYLLGLAGSSTQPWVRITTGGSVTSFIVSNPLPIGVWSHITGTWDGTNIRIYVNGVEDAASPVTTIGTLDTSGGDLGIGRHADAGTGRGLNGSIDDVRIYDKALTVTEISDLYSIGGGGIIARWKLDETTGSTIADSVGTNTGTWTDDNNSLVEETTTGKIDNALTFVDASNNAIVTVPNNASLEGFSQFTLSAWVKPSANSAVGGGRIVSKSNGATADDYSLGLGQFSTRPWLRVTTTSSSTDFVVADSLPMGVWSHVAGTWDGINMRIYVNGAEDAGNPVYKPGTLETSGGDLGIGRHADSGTSRGLNGDIDDVRIYDKAFTPIQVNNLYICANPGTMNYNETKHVYQWCGASDLVYDVTNSAGSGGAGCAASGALLAGLEGSMQYDTANDKMVFCGGTNWIDIPN